MQPSSQTESEYLVSLIAKARKEIKAIEGTLNPNAKAILEEHLPSVSAQQLTSTYDASKTYTYTPKDLDILRTILAALKTNPELTSHLVAMDIKGVANNLLFSSMSQRTLRRIVNIGKFVEATANDAQATSTMLAILKQQLDIGSSTANAGVTDSVFMMQDRMLEDYCNASSTAQRQELLSAYQDLTDKLLWLQSAIVDGRLSKMNAALQLDSNPKYDQLFREIFHNALAGDEITKAKISQILLTIDMTDRPIQQLLITAFNDSYKISMMGRAQVATSIINAASVFANSSYDPISLRAKMAAELMGEKLDEVKFVTDAEYLTSLSNKMITYAAQHPHSCPGACMIVAGPTACNEALNAIKNATHPNAASNIKPRSHIKIIYPMTNNRKANLLQSWDQHRLNHNAKQQALVPMSLPRLEQHITDILNTIKASAHSAMAPYTIIYRSEIDCPEPLREKLTKDYAATFIKIDDLSKAPASQDAILLTAPQNAAELKLIQQKTRSLIQLYRAEELCDQGFELVKVPEDPSNIQTQIDIKCGASSSTLGLNSIFKEQMESLNLALENPNHLEPSSERLLKSIKDFLGMNFPFIYGLNHFNRDCVMDLVKIFKSYPLARKRLLQEFKTKSLDNKIPYRAAMLLEFTLNNTNYLAKKLDAITKHHKDPRNFLKSFNKIFMPSSIAASSEQKNYYMHTLFSDMRNLINHVATLTQNLRLDHHLKNTFYSQMTDIVMSINQAKAPAHLKMPDGTEVLNDLMEDLRYQVALIKEVKQLKIYAKNPLTRLLQFLHLKPLEPSVDIKAFNDEVAMLRSHLESLQTKAPELDLK